MNNITKYQVTFWPKDNEESFNVFVYACNQNEAVLFAINTERYSMYSRELPDKVEVVELEK